MGLAVLLALGLNLWLLRRLSPEEKLVGAHAPWLVLTLMAGWLVPGAAYGYLKRLPSWRSTIRVRPYDPIATEDRHVQSVITKKSFVSSDPTQTNGPTVTILLPYPGLTVAVGGKDIHSVR